MDYVSILIAILVVGFVLEKVGPILGYIVGGIVVLLIAVRIGIKNSLIGGGVLLLIALGLRNCDFMLKQSCVSSLTPDECTFVVELCKEAKERGRVKSAKDCVKRNGDYY